MKRAAPAIVVVILAIGAFVGLGGARITPAPSGSPAGSVGPGATPGVPRAAAPASPTPAAHAAPSMTPMASAAASPAPSVSPSTGSAGDVAIVPVVEFRSALETVGPADAGAAIAGTSPLFAGLILVRSQAPAILQALGLAGNTPAKLVLVDDAAGLATTLEARRNLLGFLRADAAGPAVRALAWQGRALFGVDRVSTTSAWTLRARLPQAARPFDPARLWTLAAAGDIMLDRGVYRETILRGRGVNFPFAGGQAAIVGHTCCTAFGWPIPLTKRLGGAGAVRAITKGADLALANHEGPAPVNATYHTQGTVFSFDQRLEPGLAQAGFDWVSLANNHIGDRSGAAILQTLAVLDRLHIAHGGAGATQAAARAPTVFDVGGVKVAVLGRDAIAARYWAQAARPGSAGLVKAQVVADIHAARAAGADVVIVFPHWGVEYHATPTSAQRALAKAMIDAGADMVIGNHVHWAAAMEVYKGRPIWYGLGNFVFDQTWSEQTQQGLLLELTFDGKRLVQARIHPLQILDSSQPNLLDPAGSGRVVMTQVFNASKGLLAW